jgi:outer membrane protein
MAYKEEIMKRLFALMIVLLMSSYAYAEDGIKIGYVDLQRALNESDIGKSAKSELEGMMKVRQELINDKIREKEQRQEEFEKQAMALSEKVRIERQEELKLLERDIKRLIDDINVKMQKIQRDKEREIIQGIDSVISEIGKEQGYSIILPIDVILYSEDDADLTDMVIERFNNMAKAKAEEAEGQGAKESE